MKTVNKIEKIINNYENKPKVSIFINGNSEEIHLEGGHYQARNDVEDYFSKRKQIIFISNRPTGKTIGLK
jgi:hypothetical protein